MSATTLEDFAVRDRLRVMTISHATDLWLGELERKNHSARTIDTYRRLLDKLADGYPHIDVDELTTTQVRRFLDDQARKRDGARKAAATIAQNVTIINGFLDWLTSEGVIDRNPARRNGDRVLSRPKQLSAIDNDNVTTVSSADVQRLLAAADRSERWNERLAVYCLAYLGPRRQALAHARVSAYDRHARTLTFLEKGGKTIAKPVPHKLADLIDEAIRDQEYASVDDYLIAGRAPQRKPGERSDKIVWHLVRSVAKRAGVKTHVHALRAAFAVYYLETHRDENAIFALKDLMGHARIETTLVYLRRLDRRQSMETVRDLDWSPPLTTGLAPHDNYRQPQIAAKTLEPNAGTEKEGFEPSSLSEALLERVGSQRAAAAPVARPV